MPKRSNLKTTKRAVDALRVDDGDATFWDHDLTGFGVRVHATGREVNVVQSRGPVGLKRDRIGRHSDITVDTARA